MITASPDFLRTMEDSRNFLAYIGCELTDGTTLNLTNSDIRMGSLSFSKASSGDSTFDIGSFIVGKFGVTLNNIDGRFGAYEFDGAVLTVQMGLSGVSERVQIGVYTVTDTSYNSSWISLTAYDNGLRFQAAPADITLTYPMTGAAFVRAIASAAGVSVAALPTALSAMTITAPPEGIEPNMLQAVAWAAMLAGCNARITPQGALAVDWYDVATLSSTWSAIEADGWDEVDVYELTGISSARISLTDIVIAGVTLTYTADDGTETSVGTGTSDYMLHLAGNPFVNASNAAAVLTNLADALIGLRFRACEVATIPNPLLEPGDIVRFKDRRGSNYLTILTHVDFTLGSYTSSGCGAEDPRRHAVVDYSAIARTVQQTRAVAQRASKIAGNTNQHFWFVETGSDTGAHITEVTQEEFLADPDNGGGNLLARSNGIAMRNGLRELVIINADGMQVYSDTQTPIKIAHLGYGGGENQSGGQSNAPYFSFGPRSSTNVGNYSVVAGHYCSAAGYAAFAEGAMNTSSGRMSHAEGGSTEASDFCTHAEGNQTKATGSTAHAEGERTVASGDHSHAGGYWTRAAGESQTVIGQFNVEDDHKYLFIIGNGTDNDTRSNAFAVTWDGDIVLGRSPISTVTGSSVSLANNTATTVASITLDKGNYILTGVARFAANATGRRTMFFSKAQNSGNPWDIFALEQINPSQSGVTYNTLTWPVEITADNTTVYLNVSQNSGGALTADQTGIKAVRIG